MRVTSHGTIFLHVNNTTALGATITPNGDNMLAPLRIHSRWTNQVANIHPDQIFVTQPPPHAIIFIRRTKGPIPTAKLTLKTTHNINPKNGDMMRDQKHHTYSLVSGLWGRRRLTKISKAAESAKANLVLIYKFEKSSDASN